MWAHQKRSRTTQPKNYLNFFFLEKNSKQHKTSQNDQETIQPQNKFETISDKFTLKRSKTIGTSLKPARTSYNNLKHSNQF